MWNWWKKQAVGPLSDTVRLVLSQQRGLDERAVADLKMVRREGLYSGRKVTYFRVFDPGALKVAGIEPRAFADLDATGILYSGHIETQGQVVLNR